MKTGYVCFDNSCVEIATTQEEMRTGLMNRISLPEDSGSFGPESSSKFALEVKGIC